MAGSTQIHSLRHALDLYADGQYDIDELVPFIEQYDFAPIRPGGGFPQQGTMQEIVAFWQADRIPDEDYELILGAISPLSPASS